MVPFRSVAFPWFSISVKTHHEKAVCRALEGKGYSVFLPMYQSHHRAGKRTREALLPLIPTYVFASFDPLKRLPVLTIPGVFYVLVSGGVPAAIPVSELEAIDRVVQSGLPVEPAPFLVIGDSVYIEHGPLQGLRGELTAFHGAWRLVVSVQLLQRSVSVEIDRDWVGVDHAPYVCRNTSYGLVS
jgi:transcription antitermination factor NusG